MAELVPSITHVIQVQGPGGEKCADADFNTLLDAENGDDFDFERFDGAETTAIYCPTGGTTGAPKIARLKHKGVAYQRWANSAMKGMTRNDLVFDAGPLFYAGGICVDSLPCFANGMTTVIPDPFGFRN